MLDILLFLLKCIGYLLLGVFGLLVTILIVTLLVPVRYRLKVSHGDKTTVDGTATWLLHILRAKYTLKEKKKRIWIRLFGIIVYDSTKVKKPKKAKKKSSKKKKQRKKSTKKSSEYNVKKKQKVDTKEKIEYEHKDETKHNAKIAYNKEKTINKDETIKKEKSIHEDEPIDNYEPTNNGETIKDESIKHEAIKDESIKDETSDHDEYDDDDQMNQERWYHKIKDWKEQIKNYFTKFKEKIMIFCQSLINMKDKLRNIREFLDLEENKLGLGTSFASLTKIILHLKPSKMESRFRFGTGDPCTTGQALGIAAFLYGIYGENIQIIPDFEEKVFEGYHYVKGRIRLGTLLIIVIKLVIGKEFKKLNENFKILKEVL